MAQRFYSNRYGRKRASYDSSIKLDNKSKNSSVHGQTVKQSYVDLAELSIDLKSKKNLLSVHPRNYTHRHTNETQKNNLCELREEVEQLRMENQSLREEIKQLKSSEAEAKYQAMRLKEERYLDHQKMEKLENQLRRMEEKAYKYSLKIKELYQSLINEKKLNAGLEGVEMPKLKMTLSPSARSISTHHFRQFEQEGEKDFYASIGHFYHEQSKKQGKNSGWSLQNSYCTPSPQWINQHNRETFGTIY